jgi:small multidrug resistance pump
MLKFLIIAFAAVILTAVAQVLLKFGAVSSSKHSRWIKHYMNIYIFSGYGLFLTVTIINLYAYKYLPLKYAIILLPFVFIFVTLFSYFFFKETLTKRQLISYVLIIIGVVVYNLK